MPVPVLSVAQMRDWERATWATGQTETAVIQRVGATLAARCLALTPHGTRLLLLAGKGHNGDDVRAMEPHLKGREVTLVNVLDPAGDLQRVQAALDHEPDLVVDGLFGIGLSRPLDAAWLRIFQKVNDANARVLAVDVPSGLNAETGDPFPECIRADITLTVGAPKRGLLAANAWAHAGKLEVLNEVGLIPCPAESDLEWTLPEDFRSFPPRRPESGHKGTFGHVAIVAGSFGYHGAAVLAARGAQRARPGLVSVITQPNVHSAVASQLQAPMVYAWGNHPDLSKFTALLFGPGLASAEIPSSVGESLRMAWAHFPGAVVVDASALEWLEPNARLGNARRVITPHPGEAARLLGCTAAEVQQDRAGSLRRLSERFGRCLVVLKGHQTLVGRSSGEISVNSSGNSGLGQGGSGDLLAGFITGLLAQPAMTQTPEMTLRYAVWEHGRAAERLSQRRRNWTIEELADELGQ